MNDKGKIWLSALLLASVAMSAGIRAMPQTSVSLPTYQSAPSTPLPTTNPFDPARPLATGGLPTCPHVCLIVSDGESAQDAIAQFERSNHCSIDTTGEPPPTPTGSCPAEVPASGASAGTAAADCTMIFGESGKDLLKEIETLRLKPYNDQTSKEVDKWVEGATVGYGHLILKSDWDTYKNGITKEEADKLFESDSSEYVDAVNEAITVAVTQQQFDAMVILAYNIGPAGFKGSSVAKLVNDPSAVTSYATLEDAWKAFNKSQGKINQGLINRRNAEWDIYSTGVYARW